jgi:hypothetical protein
MTTPPADPRQEAERRMALIALANADKPCAVHDPPEFNCAFCQWELLRDLLERLTAAYRLGQSAERARQQGLIQKWRNRAEPNFADPEASEDTLNFWRGVKRCADELESAP